MEKRKAIHPQRTPCNQPAIAILTHAQTQHRRSTQLAQLLRAPHTHVSSRHQHWHCNFSKGSCSHPAGRSHAVHYKLRLSNPTCGEYVTELTDQQMLGSWSRYQHYTSANRETVRDESGVVDPRGPTPTTTAEKRTSMHPHQPHATSVVTTATTTAARFDAHLVRQASSPGWPVRAAATIGVGSYPDPHTLQTWKH